ncbi:DUF3572 domain-containing protein [Minwuia sp.]|uniref:DUF3572 domain-containing protein n=1 Tax=Minwuia sp. TaxID=2493630 RepID=UPI003A9073DD
MNETAHVMALNAIQHIAGDERLLSLFMQQAGMTPDLIRDRIMEPEFQGGVLDFIMSDDRIALDFCAAFGHRPDTLQRVRRALPGAPDEYY